MTPPPGLIYYPDSRPGISRRRAGRGFTYKAPDGTTIDDRRERKRIERLAVPPAYEKVWISPEEKGHLQATGYDARERKQYRYHPEFREHQERKKYDDLAAFGEALPRIRRVIREDLHGEAGERDFAIAAVLALIDRTAIRVGHEGYTVLNRTYGATTLKPRHLTMTEGALELKFRGKGGKKVRTMLRDKRLAKVLGQLHDLPGKALISWVDEAGAAHSVHSEEVNSRLSAIVGQPGITAKTFRTWAGSEAALVAALQDGPATIKTLSQAAAERLSNTPTIARNSYIHPRVIDLAGTEADERLALLQDLPERAELRRAERALLRLIG
ncbi:DNA topoisomerase IB [Wenxinia marina]|uniref:DNA topoisomerase n=1 Tax=Wenxinia marina DSM 24838 TaxID=1123501 RepID=A0A0D0QJD4_9RHOB|nr:DNA topoisomerase IB [Wenxinia marina]KIQ71138.1 Topoisomerase IB [Wenxinia marina DSM 24838]GGL54554.1 DNA topoisomerase [Wenxinia marina]